MTLPFIPIRIKGGKDEEWMISLGGQPLVGHFTLGDRQSAENYIIFLNEQVKNGTFSPQG